MWRVDYFYPATLRRFRGATWSIFHPARTLSLSEHYLPDVSNGNIWNYLSPDECEDAVALYLQKALGFLLQPSTAKHSTPDIEFLMIHRDTGEQVGVQVKSGNSVVNHNALSALGMKVYAFSIVETASRKSNPEVVDLSPKKIVAFLRSNVASLPGTLKHWVEYTEPKAENKRPN